MKMTQKKVKTFGIMLVGIILAISFPALAQENNMPVENVFTEPDYNSTIDKALDSVENVKKEITEEQAPQIDEAYDINPSESLPEKAIIDLLEANNTDINEVLNNISQKTGVTFKKMGIINGVVTIYLKDVKLKDALKIILTANNLAYFVEGGQIFITAEKEYEDKFGHSFEHDIKTRIATLNGTKFKEIKESLERIKSNLGQVIFNEKTNSFILIDSPEKLDEMTRIIQDLDIDYETKEFKIVYVGIDEAINKINDFFLNEKPLFPICVFDKSSAPPPTTGVAGGGALECDAMPPEGTGGRGGFGSACWGEVP